MDTLQIIREIGKTKLSKIVECKCVCGKIFNVSVVNLNRTTRPTKSCGCLRVKACIKRSTKHNHNKVGQRTSEYNTWVGMKNRCYNKNNIDYKYYGERGIKICDRWLNSFKNFIEDMGLKPTHKHTIERKNVNGNYEPSNCYWETRKIQGKNRRNVKRLELYL